MCPLYLQRQTSKKSGQPLCLRFQGQTGFFLDYTVQRRRPQHARTLIPMNTRTQTIPL
jgi:hypothetical protein